VTDLTPAFREIPSGADLLERIAELFANHHGWIQAVGFVEDAELRLATNGADAQRSCPGRFTLAQLSGPLGGPYGATLSRWDGERSEVLAGVLVRATSAEVSALCLPASLGTRPRPPTPAPLATVAKGEQPAPVPSGSAFAARVGLSGPRDDDDSIDELPEPGDRVEHFAFGLCEVLKVEGDRLVLRDLRPPGRIREIASEKLAISGPEERDGKRLFKLSKR
jgi:hypothetical protein